MKVKGIHLMADVSRLHCIITSHHQFVNIRTTGSGKKSGCDLKLETSKYVTQLSSLLFVGVNGSPQRYY